MSNLTNYAENKLVDALLRGQAIGTPATWHIGLASAVSDAEGGTLTELSGGGYARVAVSASLANFSGTQAAASTVASSGTGGVSSNNVVISFPTPTGAQGVATHFVFFDAATGGNAWIVAPLTASKTINNGDPAPSFAAAALSFQIN